MDSSPPTGESDLFQLAFELAPSGMLAVGPSGEILLANREAERVFGYGPGELRGVGVDQLVPQALRSGHAAHRDGFFRTPATRRMGAGRDLFGLRRDGSEFPIEIGLNPVRLAGGPVVIASVVDITARRDAEEQSRQIQKLEALGTLAGGIAHDFNNILLGIVGYSELAQRQLRDRPEAAADLDQVLKAAERGRQLVRRILLFTRHHEVARTPIALERVVREAADLLRASLPATIEMRTTVEPGVPPVLGDETLVHQVLLNLATNAAHAMSRGGTLRIALAPADVDAEFARSHPGTRAGRHARLSVIDDGEGMSPEVRERIFEPFFTTKPPGQGTGLGLPVILGIVQAMHGAIDVTSAAGEGTRVDVWLPATAADERAGEAAPAAPAPPAARHVLFVEDEPALAVMERRQLESLGYRVTVHTSSVDALEDFMSRPEAFDLMITDNTMPRLTGLALARRVTEKRPELRVLMISGYAENADPALLAEHGVRGVLRKPHSAAELDEALRALFETR